MQNIRLTPRAAYQLQEKLRELLDALNDDDIRSVEIRADDLSEVEVHVEIRSVIGSSHQ